VYAAAVIGDGRVTVSGGSLSATGTTVVGEMLDAQSAIEHVAELFDGARSIVAVRIVP
jgi:hypothetical protein